MKVRHGLLASALCSLVLSAHADEAAPSEPVPSVPATVHPDMPPTSAAGADSSAPGSDLAVAEPASSPRALEEGEASWYGLRFHGRRTASGERFDQTALTAAHPWLPFGTRVRVEHVATGASVVVRINDRGPFRGLRIIDLSRAAARLLGLVAAGSAQVRIWPLGEDLLRSHISR